MEVQNPQSNSSLGYSFRKWVDCFLTDLPIYHSDMGEPPFFGSLPGCLLDYPWQ